jgi:hypothetical protein
MSLSLAVFFFKKKANDQNVSMISNIDIYFFFLNEFSILLLEKIIKNYKPNLDLKKKRLFYDK